MKIKRNDLCPCGSGKKFKKCCESNDKINNKSANPELLFQQAKQQHQQGFFVQAEILYQQILSIQPQRLEVINLLGVVLYQQKRHKDAISKLSQVTKRKPTFADAWSNLGLAFLGDNQVNNAEKAFIKAMQINPNFINVHLNMALLYEQTQRFIQAEKCYLSAEALQADSVEVQQKMAQFYSTIGNIKKAILHYQKATQLAPENPEFQNSLGLLYLDNSQWQLAIEHFNQAIKLQPSMYIAINNLGSAYSEMGDIEHALQSYQQALNLSPDNIYILNNMAQIEEKRFNYSGAEPYYLKALEIKADFVEVLHNLSMLYFNSGRLEPAFEKIQQAINSHPQRYNSAQNLCAFKNYDPCIDSSELARIHFEFANNYMNNIQAKTYQKQQYHHKRIRIGYLSSDFRCHPIAFFIEGILKHHDKDLFEIYCYSNNSLQDKITQMLQSLTEHWCDVTLLSDQVLAQQIEGDQIDILVDLNGHTQGNRMPCLATKPAPVLVNYLGYPNTTGMKVFDYRLSDNYCDPTTSNDQNYSEQLLRLPNSFFCYSPPKNSPEISDLPLLKNKYITFGSFNGLYKLSESVLTLYARVLSEITQSRLVLQTSLLKDKQIAEQVFSQFERLGISRERIDLLPATSLEEYLNYHNKIDIILDCFPWNGHTTSCHALWMGVPLITLAGDRHASRIGGSLLHSLKMDEWIANNQDEYISKACSLASDSERLMYLRSSLRDRMQSTFVDSSQTFTQNLEDLYKKML
jgi:protein O-GlcNAc transferase